MPLKQWEGTEEWTQPNYDWRITSNPITTGGSATWHHVVREPSLGRRCLSLNNLRTPTDPTLETPDQHIPDVLPKQVQAISAALLLRYMKWEQVQHYYYHHQRPIPDNGMDIFTNTFTDVTEEQNKYLCLDRLWHRDKDLDRFQKQKQNMSISVCASWRQCMMKPLEKSGMKLFSRQQETITFQVFPLLVELRDWYGIFKVKLMQKASARRVQEAVSCPGTITAHSNRKAARLWGAKMTSASAIK